MEIIRWVKFITVVWPLIIFIAMLAFLVIFFRPLYRILARFDCKEVERFKIGPIEIVKQSRPKHKRNLRREKNQGGGTRGCSNTSTATRQLESRITPQDQAEWQKGSSPFRSKTSRPYRCAFRRKGNPASGTRTLFSAPGIAAYQLQARRFSTISPCTSVKRKCRP
jgi:hypothetical protein